MVNIKVPNIAIWITLRVPRLSGIKYIYSIGTLSTCAVLYDCCQTGCICWAEPFLPPSLALLATDILNPCEPRWSM